MNTNNNRYSQFVAMFFVAIASIFASQNLAFGQTVIIKEEFSGLSGYEMFRDTFDDNDKRAWYAQMQAGGISGPNSHEFELGGYTGTLFANDPYYISSVSWINEANNPFTIEINSGSDLRVTVNSIGTPSGNAYGVVRPYNVVYVGLLLNSALDLDFFSTNSVQTFSASLPNLSLQGDSEALYNSIFQGFSFYLDEEYDNIGAITISGNLLQNTLGGSIEDWTYTVFGYYDSGLIPEPSQYVLCFSIISFLFIMFKKRK